MYKIIFAAAAVAVMGAGAAFAQTPPTPAAKPADMIKNWDKNGDGAVDKSEWTTAGRPADRFAAVDADKDGKITAAELEKAMAGMHQRPGS